MSKRWSYQTVEVQPNMWGVNKPDAIQEQLTRLGQQGWELVSVIQGLGLNKPILILKREQ